MIRKLIDAKENLRIFKKKVRIKPLHNVAIWNKYKMYLKGFTPDQYIQYNFKENDIKEYVSEFERQKTKKLNGKYNIIADNKIIFEKMFKEFVNVPQNYFWINDRIINSLTKEYENFMDLLKEKSKLIIKPVQGTGGGKGVNVLGYEDSLFYFNNSIVTEEELLNKILGLNDYIVTEYVKQHEYAQNLYSNTTNTIRLITIKESNSYIIPIAVQRIGVKNSIPVDNASKGGLVSEINLETGILNYAKNLVSENKYYMHPDTGNIIEGVQIPMWNEIKKEIIKTAEKFPYVLFLAWDILITEKGFYVIEVNKSTDFNLLQLNYGQKNKKLGNFYKEHGIFKK